MPATRPEPGLPTRVFRRTAASLARRLGRNLVDRPSAARSRGARPRPSVGIITPTTGAESLRSCARSVAEQTYGEVVHYVVVDGPRFDELARSRLPDRGPRTRVVVLPENTGGNGYFGHRIYGALPYLVNTDLVCFLDQDNWFDDIHVEALVDTIQQADLGWAYSLRKVTDADGAYLCNDDCDSLGIWGQWYGEQHHIDANCYMMKRSIAVECSSIWHRKGYSKQIADPDKALCRWLLSNRIRGFTSGRYTLNYRLGSTEDSVKHEYFVEGNGVMRARYRYYPWANAKLDHISDATEFRRIVT